MIGIGSAQAYSVRVQPVMERILARRLEHATSETRESPRREGAERPPQLQESTRPNDGAARAAALSFSSGRALAGRLNAQSLSDAAANPDRAGNESKSAAQASDHAITAERSKPTSPTELSDEEKAAVQKLSARDQEVRNHERAHKSAGGQYAGAISYAYQKGPDGKQYAIGGEVPIDVSPEASPEATIQKMNIVIGAALAPAEPSGQDQAVARAAQVQRNQALAELSADKAAERETLRTRGSETPEKLNSPTAAAAASAQKNIYDLMRAVIDGAPENRLFRMA